MVAHLVSSLGNCDFMAEVVRNGTHADIRHEVERVLAEWPHPGLCLATASAMMEDVPHDNITEMYRLFRALGRGRGGG